MRITPYNQMGTIQPNQTGPRAERSGPSFRLPDEKKDTKATQSTSGHAGTASIGSLETLLALQGVDSEREKRQRSMKRGRTILDLLDKIKVSMLGGEVDPATLLRLNLASLPAEKSGDDRLDSILEEIDLRAQVELAKFEVAKRSS